MLIQLCVVFASNKEKEKKNLNNIPIHSFNITNNAY